MHHSPYFLQAQRIGVFHDFWILGVHLAVLTGSRRSSWPRGQSQRARQVSEIQLRSFHFSSQPSSSAFCAAYRHRLSCTAHCTLTESATSSSVVVFCKSEDDKTGCVAGLFSPQLCSVTGCRCRAGQSGCMGGFAHDQYPGDTVRLVSAQSSVHLALEYLAHDMVDFADDHVAQTLSSAERQSSVRQCLRQRCALTNPLEHDGWPNTHRGRDTYPHSHGVGRGDYMFGPALACWMSLRFMSNDVWNMLFREAFGRYLYILDLEQHP